MGEALAWDWLTAVRSPIATNLSNQVGTMSRALSLRGLRVSVSSFDRAAMVLGEHALDGPSFMLRPPDPYAPTCAYVELAAHFARMAQTVDHRTDIVVAVVSGNGALRTFHRSVRLGQQPGKVELIAPTEIIAPGGRVYRYGDSKAEGATIFDDDVGDLAHAGRIDLAVVDAPCRRMLDVLEFADRVAFVVRDASDPAVARLAAKMPIFAWDSADVAAIPLQKRMVWEGPRFASLAPRLANLAAGVEVNFVNVPGDRVTELAADAWLSLPEVMKAVPATVAGRELMALGFRRYHQMMNLVVPTDEFNRYFGSLENSVRSLATAARLVRGDGGDFYIPYFAEQLRDLATAIGPRAPKVDAFERLVGRLVNEYGRASVRVAALNSESATLIDDWLARTMPQPPDVLPLSALPQQPPSEHLIFTGMISTWARGVLRSGVARHMYILAYTSSAASSTSEAELVASAIARSETYARWMARPEARQLCWADLTHRTCDAKDPQPAAPVIEIPQSELVEEHGAVELWTSLLRPGAFSRSEHPNLADGGRAGVADASIATFQDGRWLLLASDSWVTRVNSGHTEEGVAMSRLKPGDRLVIIDGDPRKALLDKIVEKGADVPEYAAVSELVRVWRDAVRSAYLRFRSYRALNERFSAFDVEVTDVTVGNWVKGSVIGPLERDNVRRVGEALGHDVLVRKYRLICDAITTLRGIHIKLGIRLGSLALREGAAGALGARDVDEVIDDVSGLTVGDFRSCVEFLTVRSIQHFGEVPLEMLGTMRNPDEKLEEESRL